MDNKDVAKRWFSKGNNDLVAGDYILTMPLPPTDTICFHSQQAAEKYLKYARGEAHEGSDIDLMLILNLCYILL
ncbi:MAG: HEPN domain-containing protein [Candidatus Methanoperedens sp.]|nr:HEPN domain-containing protein [Candidatus Methanoperedens sp.]MCE8427345.1 HEPN domain-containing protein [Candidatus Methanoperedens sp.]